MVKEKGRRSVTKVAGFGRWSRGGNRRLQDSEVESLQAAVVGQEAVMGQPWHAQQAFAAELLLPVF